MNSKNSHSAKMILPSNVLPLIFIIISTSVFANLKQDLSKIINLIAQQPDQAYALALAKANDYEGLNEFDYVLGLAAYKSKHFNQAIFALERVVKNSPELLSPRYTLASSYFHAGNLEAAKVEFNQLKSISNADIKKTFPQLKDYLSAIETLTNQAKGKWQSQIDLGLGYDSNANSGVDVDVINIPLLGEIKLFDNSKTISGSFTQTQLQTSYVKPLNKKSSWYGIGKVRYANYNDKAEMDRIFADLFFGYQHKLAKTKYHINGFYRPLWFDANSNSTGKYLDYYGISSSIERIHLKDTKCGVDLSYANLAYHQTDLDRDQLLANVWYQLTIKQFTSKLSLLLGQENPDNNLFKHLGRDYLGVNYHLSTQLNNAILINTQFDYIRSNYQAKHPLFNKTRDDTLFKATVSYQQQFNKQWSWLVNLIYLKNKSELPLYNYQRALVSTVIRYKF